MAYLLRFEFRCDCPGRAIEAHRVESTVTDRKGSWTGQSLSYLQGYTTPVVLGQVMSANDPDWSVFWDRGSWQTNPPDGSNLRVGKTVCEDTDTTRANEVLGVVIVEAGAGSVEDVAYRADVGSDTVLGVTNSPPYAYSFSPAFGSAPQVALVSQAAMDGGDGGWAVLYGASPLSASTLDLAIDEDQISDSERNHTTEQVAYLVFEEDVVYPPVGGTTGRTLHYTYDPLGRLTDADYSTGESYDYTYDAVGNRLSYSGPDGSHTYTYDAASLS